jgi:hypothetical protein
VWVLSQRALQLANSSSSDDAAPPAQGSPDSSYTGPDAFTIVTRVLYPLAKLERGGLELGGAWEEMLEARVLPRLHTLDLMSIK